MANNYKHNQIINQAARVFDKTFKIVAILTKKFVEKIFTTYLLEFILYIAFIFYRMDEDYVARNLARKMFKANDPDYYEWETHIFFDDAFEPDDSGKHFVANQFVKLLVKEMDEQGKRWYGARKMKVPYPAKYPVSQLILLLYNIQQI